MKRPIARSFGSALLFGLLFLASVGCGEDLADESYGGLDLAPFFYDGSSPGNPSAGLPGNITPIASAWEGRKAEFYDFGLVPVRQDKPDPNTAAIYGIDRNGSYPKFATVNPMYFFFDAQRRPLFPRPALEKRTWQFHMRGPLRDGEPWLDPNPKEDADRRLAYPVRERNLWTDPKRNVAEYQRPIIDVIQDDQNNYSGLWEVTLVVAPAGYRPDSIKSYATLKKGIDAGDFRVVRTGRVVNCPVLDERTYVTPTTMDHHVPRPRVDVWYRRKLGSCYLVDGWEAIGDTRNDEDDDIANDEYYLYNADEIEQRLNVMDTFEFKLGDGKAAVTRLFAPVSRLFVPRIEVPNQSGTVVQLRWLAGLTVDGALPRRKADDPPGYRPIRWAWDITVPTGDPAYRVGTDTYLRAASRLDTSQITPRSSFARNVPLLGVPVNCGKNKTTGKPDVDEFGNESGNEPLDADPCPRLGLECPLKGTGRKFSECSTPLRRYGEYCAPAVARCPDVVSDSDQVEIAFFKDVVTPQPATGDSGFICHGGANGTGHCYFRCDGTQPNLDYGRSVTITAEETDDFPATNFTVFLDSRCGGEKMPGFQCLPYANATSQRGGRVCLRACDPQRPIVDNERMCRVPTVQTINSDPSGTNLDLSKDTACLSASQITGCVKDVAFEPR